MPMLVRSLLFGGIESFTTVGTADFYADGTWSNIQSASVNGMVSLDFTSNGTWDVTPDCRFHISDGTDSGTGSVVNNANEILFMDAGEGLALTFRVVRVDTKD